MILFPRGWAASLLMSGFLALGLASVPARVSAQSGRTGNVAGVVMARGNGQPVNNALITIEGEGAMISTNGIGRFRLVGVAAGRVALLVQAPGFLKLRIPDVEVSEAGEREVEIELQATPNMMELVQVTATKEALSVGDVAAQADIVSGGTIAARGDLSLVQAINHVPGAIVSTQLGIFESVMLRGMPRGDPEFTNTLLLIDGVPQTNSNNGARVVALPVNDANSVEVVRGPNSALYGRTAIGGAVNVRTADPTPAPVFGFDLSGGQFGYLKAVAKASGPIQQWGGYYVSLASERNHGYFKSTADYRDGNDALFTKVSFVPDRKSYGSVSFNRVVSDNSTPTNEPVINGQFLHDIDARFDRLTNFNIPGPNYHQGEGRVTFNYNRQLSSWVRVTEVLGYRSVQHKFINDGDFIASPYDLVANTVSMYPFSQQLDEDIVYQELRLDMTSRDGRFRQTLGGSYEWNRGKLASDFIFNDPDLFGFTIDYLNPVIPPIGEWQHDTGSRRYNLGITGVFGQYMAQPVSRLIFTGGWRYDRLRMDVTRLGSARVEKSFHALSPKGTVTVKLLGTSEGGPTLNGYAAYSQAFLPPRRPSSLTPADVPLPLQPENIDNWEVGLKGGLWRGRVGLEATYFRMREDGVVLSQRSGPFFLPTNSGRVRYKGFETGVRVAPSGKFSAYLNSSFYRNRFGTFVIESEDGDTVLTGNRLPIAPEYVVNWGASFNPSQSVDANLNVKHVSAVQTNNDNTFLLQPYSVADAALSWSRGAVRLTVAAHNIFNTEYYWNSDGETADPGRPRQVVVTLSTRFGGGE